MNLRFSSQRTGITLRLNVIRAPEKNELRGRGDAAQHSGASAWDMRHRLTPTAEIIEIAEVSL